MTYRFLSDAAAIQRNIKTFEQLLRADATHHRRLLISRGGTRRHTVHWHEDPGYWSYSRRQIEADRYRCVFGLTSPIAHRYLRMTVQFNMPLAGANIPTAGRLIRDSYGRIWLAHSGNVAPGVKGGGRTAFRKVFRGRGEYRAEKIPLPDGKHKWFILVARLDDPKAVIKIGCFVQKVNQVKLRLRQLAAVKEGKLP